MKDLKAEMFQKKQNQTRNSLNLASETKPGTKPTIMTVCLQNISQSGTFHPGIFHWRTLSADSVSLQTTTIGSREQFKPINWRNFVVNCIKLNSKVHVWYDDSDKQNGSVEDLKLFSCTEASVDTFFYFSQNKPM